MGCGASTEGAQKYKAPDAAPATLLPLAAAAGSPKATEEPPKEPDCTLSPYKLYVCSVCSGLSVFGTNCDLRNESTIVPGKVYTI